MNCVIRSHVASLLPRVFITRLNSRGFLTIRRTEENKTVTQSYSVLFTRNSQRSLTSTLNDPESLSWEDYEDIAELLHEEYPSTNPLSLRFTELHDNVENVVLASSSRPITGKCSEGALEKIQMAWLELHESDNS
ncbi:hypothetical protein BEWA_033820 [Theileria equi strain WA]|uniref:FeS assembly protein IscX n=1 Tax=Theileria equi strain WA TaxID=1537102 RepID=L0AY68_THEEQ|nr:hypothetical protein BEWA_033820 [Theileria equi strain WA]AFZ80527.1 hypothetical protein BEWA_033820 [Theileria equi strain WA]|eukprot:XP_004830193.1 hypothetical protein BEWA_033820 [Theileria equi strain WA]